MYLKSFKINPLEILKFAFSIYKMFNKEQTF